MLWTHQQARANQLPPDGDWRTWLILSGRGWGKTRTGAEWLAWHCVRYPKTRAAVVAATFADARDTCVEGESGLLNILLRYRAIEPDNWNRSMGEIRLLNGSRIKVFSAEEPSRLRGPQHHIAWCDELAAWRYPETWHQLKFGLRLGTDPRVVVTTTPQPNALTRALIKDSTTVITRGSTYENAANLAGDFLTEIRAKYEGTRLGRQELYGEVLEDVEGALWNTNMLETGRVEEAPRLARVVVAVDPAATAHDASDETGIIVAGRSVEGKGYVLADYSLKASPLDWAKQVVDAYDTHQADAVVVEVNNGGDMIPTILRQVRPGLPIKQVRATRGKQTRAEPIAALYEQGRIHHVGVLAKLEAQLTEWTPDEPKSPDRLDALVWALTELMTGTSVTGYLAHLAAWCNKCNLPVPKHSPVCVQCGGMMHDGNDHPLSSIGR